MAITVNHVTDTWLQERSQAPLDRVKDWVCELGAPLVEAVQDRISVVAAGKRMLDEGGEAAELGVLAKKTACDAVYADKEIINQIQKAVDLYEDAASLLQSQAGGVGPLASLAASYTARATFHKELLASMGTVPEEPPMTDIEWDATKFVQLRQAKAQLGLRSQVGGAATGWRSGLFSTCVEQERRPASSQLKLENCSQAKASNQTMKECIEKLTQELFRLQDLKGDGLLEEAEVVKLNEKISMLHYGKDVDKTAIRDKFRNLFRSRLDVAGNPVAYPRFREYMSQVLNEIDADPRAQEMILEQFIAEANSARYVFHQPSFASASDLPFMPSLSSDALPDKSSRPVPPIAGQMLETMPEQEVSTPSVFDLSAPEDLPTSQLSGQREGRTNATRNSQAMARLHRGTVVDETGTSKSELLCHGCPINESIIIKAGGKDSDASCQKKHLMDQLEKEFEQSMPSQNSTVFMRESRQGSGTSTREQLPQARHTQGHRDLSPSSYVSKDAERQAASRRVLQDTRRATPPRCTSGRSAPHSDIPSSSQRGRLVGVVGGDTTLEPRYVS